MSIKSLLQIILFLLIILIIGGVYFLYFYTSSSENQMSLNKSLDNTTIKSTDSNISLDQELLEDNKLNQEDNVKNNNLLNGNFKYVEEQNKLNLDAELDKNNLNNISETKNITKNLEYISTNKNGDILKILAKFGKTNLNDSNILDLEEVNGVLSPMKRTKIFIASDYAKYNYSDQNSNFLVT